MRRRWVAPLLLGLLVARPALAAPDDLLVEVEAYFRAAKKWFGMVSDLTFDPAADGSLVPRWSTLHSRFVRPYDAAKQRLNAELPRDAAKAHRVWLDGDDEFFVRTRELGTPPVPVELIRGVAVYPRAVAGGDLLYKLTPTHVDEYVYFRDPPRMLRRQFEFDTGSAVWMLREAGDYVEAVGRDGVARLRLSAPLARASNGGRRRGTIHVRGNVLVVEIDLDGLVAPVLVDPDWTTTGTMTVARWGYAAWRRPDTLVMAAGGCALAACPKSFTQALCGQVVPSVDIWSPYSGTWTTSLSMNTARFGYASSVLANGDFLVAGGCTSSACVTTTALAERWVQNAATWMPAGSLSNPRANSMAALLAGGDVLVAGGCDATSCTNIAQRYSPSANGWSTARAMPGTRGFATATTLSDGRVLVTGGCEDPSCSTVLADALVFDGVQDQWTAVGMMGTPRGGHTATLLGDGTVLVAGGCADGACASTLSTAELWTGMGFTSAPSMIASRHNHSANLLQNGEVLIAGGDSSGGVTAGSEVYLPMAKQWIQPANMLTKRAYHVAVDLTDGEVLVAGGCDQATCLPWAELFSPKSLPPDSDAGVDAGPPIDSGTTHPPFGPSPAPLTPHPPSARTGVTSCISDTAKDLPCRVPGFPLQDGDYQPNTQLLEQDGDEIVDSATGLRWQKSPGSDVYDWAGATAHCANLETAKAGKGSWRLPSVTELFGIVDYGFIGPSIDPIFGATQTLNHWTSTKAVMRGPPPMAGAPIPELAWTISFNVGAVIPVLTDGHLPARCVRGTANIDEPGRIRRGGKLDVLADSVRDLQTGLEWQRRDDGVKRSWGDSLQYCAALGDGWHLPNVSELFGLIEFAEAGPITIDPAFEDTKADGYWSSTQNERATTIAWNIAFNVGSVAGAPVSGYSYVRCVRHLESFPIKASGGCGCETSSESESESKSKSKSKSSRWAPAVGLLGLVYVLRRARRQHVERLLALVAPFSEPISTDGLRPSSSSRTGTRHAKHLSANRQ